MSKQKMVYKGFGLFVRKRAQPPYFYYVLIYSDTSFSGVCADVDRDEECGIATVEEGFELAKYDIDRGLFD